MKYLLVPMLCVMLAACTGKPAKLTYKIISTHPHDPESYTQGLEHDGKNLIESSGGYELSTLREVEPATGKILRKRPMAKNVFVEGITLMNHEIWILTWKENTAYVFEPETFKFIRSYTYQGEGWGITHDGKQLIMSDGTSTLKFIDPKDFSVKKSIEVKRGDTPVTNLNELEMVHGEIFANIYQTDEIVRISPESGKVTGSLDLSALRKQLPGPNRAEALNGIALDPATGHLLVTGKLWPTLFEIELGK
ncbi:MAG: glutaminyl-peptide cyclotransferase [Verrucomicrobiota bacterium]